MDVVLGIQVSLQPVPLPSHSPAPSPLVPGPPFAAWTELNVPVLPHLALQEEPSRVLVTVLTTVIKCLTRLLREEGLALGHSLGTHNPSQ